MLLGQEAFIGLIKRYYLRASQAPYKNDMKYKRKITSGALALTLFVGGSSAYAANVQGPTTASTQPTHFFHSKAEAKSGQRNKHGARGLGLNHNKVIGKVAAITATGFTLEAHGPKPFHRDRIASSTHPEMVAFDIRTTGSTIYQKDGATSTVADLVVGQKVIVVGTIDSAAQVVSASKVNIITKIPDKMTRGAKKD